MSSCHRCLYDGDILHRPVAGAGLRLPNPVDNVHAFDYLPEDRVLPVEEIVVGKVDEELGAARVGPGICHGDRTAVVPVAGGELVLDRVTGSAPAGAGGIAALDHEAADDPVEDGAVIIPFFHERFEVPGGDRHVGCEGDRDRAHGSLEFHEF